MGGLTESLYLLNRFSQVTEINCPNSKIMYMLKINSIIRKVWLWCGRLEVSSPPYRPPVALLPVTILTMDNSIIITTFDLV